MTQKTVASDIVTDPLEAARVAHLRYVNDNEKGFRRAKHGEKFIYFDTQGKQIKDKQQLERFKSLGIPPAWSDVWICPAANGHIQATGRDEKGRKQYRYHTRWRKVRSENNFGRMLLFGEHLPEIRKQVEKNLALSGLPREKVLAVVVRLLETTLIRIGNVEYAHDNNSFGLTTMRDKHVNVNGSKVHFEFKGKSHQKHSIDLQDKRLARIVKQCRDIPGQDLFQYYDENGTHQSIGSADVNAFLREITGEDFTAKDFRTWGGTVLAVSTLCNLEPAEDDKQAQKNIVQAVKEVAQHLGNTAAVCRKYYISPMILDAYKEGALLSAWERHQKHTKSTLSPEEMTVMELLKNAL
jgi:DNA topoisomerase I